MKTHVVFVAASLGMMMASAASPAMSRGSCRDAIAVTETASGAAKQRLFDQIHAHLALIDSEHSPPLIAGMSRDGLINLAAMVHVHCLKTPELTILQASTFVYDLARGALIAPGATPPPPAAYAASSGDWKIEGRFLKPLVVGCKAELPIGQNRRFVFGVSLDMRALTTETSLAVTTALRDHTPTATFLGFDRRQPMPILGVSEAGLIKSVIGRHPADPHGEIVGLIRSSGTLTIESVAGGRSERAVVNLRGSGGAMDLVNVCVADLVRQGKPAP